MTKYSKIPKKIKKKNIIKKEHYIKIGNDINEFLKWMQNSIGKLNMFTKWIYGKANNCNISSIKTDDPDLAKICSLLSQCGATNQTINYFFCTPNIPFENLNDITLHIPISGIVNIEISIGSTKDGFPGHVLNFLIIYDKGQAIIYWIQSFIYKYSIQFQTIKPGELNSIIESYQKLFVKPQFKTFHESENGLWKKLTKADLTDYNGNFLYGKQKPTYYHQKYCFLSTYNINNYLIFKYLNLLYESLYRIDNPEPQENVSLRERRLRSAFGTLQTSESISQYLRNLIDNIQFTLQTPRI